MLEPTQPSSYLNDSVDIFLDWGDRGGRRVKVMDGNISTNLKKLAIATTPKIHPKHCKIKAQAASYTACGMAVEIFH